MLLGILANGATKKMEMEENLFGISYIVKYFEG
jgi:hypothetical protein